MLEPEFTASGVEAWANVHHGPQAGAPERGGPEGFEADRANRERLDRVRFDREPGERGDVTLAVPVIYSRVAPPARLGPLGRLAALAVAGGALAVLVVAAVLTPSHAGFGTHRELGLQPCAFRDRTGLPCPSCGFTTSFSYFARGNLPAAFYTQPMGLVLAILTAAAVWVAGYTAWSGRPIYRLLRLVPSRYSMMPLLIGALLGWGWKVFLTLRGLDGWSG